MADAKKCDVCGEFFVAGESYALVRRDVGGVIVVGQRYHWDICSVACLVKAAEQEVGANEERKSFRRPRPLLNWDAGL